MEQRRAQRRKFHYIYKITRFDGMYYIGMHSTDNLEDGYFGSGKRLWHSINKHGKDKHSKEILEFLPDRESLKLREKELVCKELLEDPQCMNLTLGGDGDWFHQNSSSDIQRSKGIKGNARMKILRKNSAWVEKTAKAMSKGQKQAYANGRVRNVDAGLKSATERARSPEAIAKRKATNRERNFQQGEKNSQFGVKRAWLNKDGQKKKVLLCEVDSLLTDGWKRGIK